MSIINEALKKAALTIPKYLAYTEEPLVSKDFNADAHSCTVDGLSTDVIDGNFVKVFGWYDNEWGCSNRVVDLADYIGSKK